MIAYDLRHGLATPGSPPPASQSPPLLKPEQPLRLIGRSTDITYNPRRFTVIYSDQSTEQLAQGGKLSRRAEALLVLYLG